MKANILFPAFPLFSLWHLCDPLPLLLWEQLLFPSSTWTLALQHGWIFQKTCAMGLPVPHFHLVLCQYLIVLIGIPFLLCEHKNKLPLDTFYFTFPPPFPGGKNASNDQRCDPSLLSSSVFAEGIDLVQGASHGGRLHLHVLNPWSLALRDLLVGRFSTRGWLSCGDLSQRLGFLIPQSSYNKFLTVFGQFLPSL